jgi:protein tyrosine/serine phosphatase
VRERTLLWDGCVNVRDLGGLPLEGGGETSFGALVRADSIRRLTDDGWAALVDYGTRTVVDLRYHSELEADPPRELPLEVVHVPLLPEPDTEFWNAIGAVSATEADDVRRTRLVYLEFLERRTAEFAAALTAVAEADGGAVVVHCVGGKDRTGLVCGLLLRLAGVPIDAVVADYGLSEPNLARRTERWLATADTEDERERRRRASVAPPEAMAGVLVTLDERYGGAEGYLRAAGVGDACLAQLRSRLRG